MVRSIVRRIEGKKAEIWPKIVKRLLIIQKSGEKVS